MKEKIIKKVLLWIWVKIKVLNVKKIIYKFWLETIRPYLQKKVNDTSNKFDEMMFSALSQIVEIFLNPIAIEEKGAKLEGIWEKIKEFFSKFSWKNFLYKIWVSHIRDWLRKIVANNEYKFDDIMLEGLEKIVETFVRPDDIKEVS